MGKISRVAVIGAGAAGAAAAAALKAEDYFAEITVFERRGSAGGTWIYDADPQELGALPLRPGCLPPDIDPPLSIPRRLPSTSVHVNQYRFETTPIYEGLTTNVPDVAMSFADLPFPYGPFVPHSIPKQYVESYFSWHKTDSNLVLNTTVEDLSRLPHGRWKLVLRRRDAVKQVDEWWDEEFDAVALATGHYSVPFIPFVPGLEQYMDKFEGRVEHSKTYRTPRAYQNLRVLVIGNSASGHDVAAQLAASHSTRGPVIVSRRSRSRWDGAHPPPGTVWKPVVSEYRPDGGIVFGDGSLLHDIDKVIYCTGYKPSYPFWNAHANGRPIYSYEDDRLINNYQHTLFHDFPTLALIGLPRVLTFRSFEYQAIAVARLWASRNSSALPSVPEQKTWEKNRRDKKPRGCFHQIDWDTGETMDWFRWLFEFAGLPTVDGHGRCPPVLGATTQWALEHIKKYPEPGSENVSAVDDTSENETTCTAEWVMAEAGPQKDSLFFI